MVYSGRARIYNFAAITEIYRFRNYKNGIRLYLLSHFPHTVSSIISTFTSSALHSTPTASIMSQFNLKRYPLMISIASLLFSIAYLMSSIASLLTSIAYLLGSIASFMIYVASSVSTLARWFSSDSMSSGTANNMNKKTDSYVTRLTNKLEVSSSPETKIELQKVVELSGTHDISTNFISIADVAAMLVDVRCFSNDR